MPSLHQLEQKGIHPLGQSSTAHAPARSYPEGGPEPTPGAGHGQRVGGLPAPGSTPREQREVLATPLTLLRTPTSSSIPRLN